MSGPVAFSKTPQKLYLGVDKTKVSDKDFDEAITALAERFPLVENRRNMSRS